MFVIPIVRLIYRISISNDPGVLWMEMTPLKNSAEVMNKFADLGKKTFYVTNNSTKTREEFVEKCDKLNFRATKDNILCTSYLAACYLQDLGFKKKVYVIGSQGEISWVR